MENPFKYGGIVRGPYFADRGEEIAELTREIKNLNRVFLVSPRRYGKTCILQNLIGQLAKQKIAAAYIDLNAYPDLRSLASAYGNATLRALENNTQKLLKLFSGLKKLRPKASIEYAGQTFDLELETTVTEKDALSALLEAMQAAALLAERNKKKLAVIIDEFSDLEKYGDTRIEKALRSEVQQHDNIAYIFSGSEQSVMLSMIKDPKRAFYKLGRIMELGPIKRQAYLVFIQDWFQKGGLAIEALHINRILDIGIDVPHNIQRLCHTLWEQTINNQKAVDTDIIESLPIIIARQDSPHYELLWQGVSQIQKALLIALAKEPTAHLFSKEFSFRFQIGPASSIKASLQSLLKKGILYRAIDGNYRFADVFMPYWIHSLQKNLK